MPTRLEKQVAFLEAHPDCAMVGTRAEIWVGGQKTSRVHDHPTDNAALQFELLFDSPFVHSSVLLRKSALDAVGHYTTDPARQPPEDYELWSRIARRYKVANLPERLTIYREVPNSMSRARPPRFIDNIVAISAENLAAAVGAGRAEPRSPGHCGAQPPRVRQGVRQSRYREHVPDGSGRGQPHPRLCARFGPAEEGRAAN